MGTVMTTVHGVTKYGASLQIAKQLKDIDDFPLSQVDPASKYLAHKTFESLNELFTASQEIQDWFTECAMIISKDCQANVSHSLDSSHMMLTSLRLWSQGVTFAS